MTKRKTSFGLVEGQPLVEITESDWSRIETAYGRKLPDAMRDEIYALTVQYALSAQHEKTAAPIADAIDRVGKIRAATFQLWTVLSERSEKLNQSACLYGETLIAQYFDKKRGIGKANVNSYPFLISFIASLAAACDEAEADLNEPNAAGHRKDEHWEKWVCHLSSVAHNNHMPYGASKGGETPPSFVALVRELQECLPTEYRRYWSDASFRQAINRAFSNHPASREL